MSLKKTEAECLPHKDPIERPDYVEADAQALRAVWRGDATPDQQKRAIDWLLQAFGTYDLSFRSESSRLTDFAEGRRSAGLILLYMLKYAPTRTDPDKISTRLSLSGEQGDPEA